MLVEEDPISDGWLCDRGRYNIGFYESPDRLKQPLYRKDGGWTQIGWDDAFILWAKAIRAAIAAHGAESVGVIGGGRLTNEEAYLIAHVFGSLRIKNLDWRSGTQRQATPGSNAGTLDAIDRAEAVVVAGAVLVERAPVLWLRIQKAVRHGAQLISQQEAGEARAAAGDAKRVALVWDGIDLAIGKSYAQAFADAPELATYIASDQANARGAEAMGLLPSADGLDTFAMLDRARSGQLAVLSIFAANPARNAPDAAAVRAALEAVPFLVVSELFMTETAERAKLVLPAAGALEKSGTTLSVGGDLLPLNAALAAADFVRNDLEIVAGLAEQLEVSLPSALEVEGAVVAAVAKERNDVTFGDARYDTPARPSGAAAEQGILSGGGTWQHDPWIAGLRVS
jgi:NADH-quinone oxidoreductase subunit G